MENYGGVDMEAVVHRMMQVGGHHKQWQLANDVGVDQTQITRWKQLDRPSPHFLERLRSYCRKYNIAPETILMGRDVERRKTVFTKGGDDLLNTATDPYMTAYMRHLEQHTYWSHQPQSDTQAARVQFHQQQMEMLTQKIVDCDLAPETERSHQPKGN